MHIGIGILKENVLLIIKALVDELSLMHVVERSRYRRCRRKNRYRSSREERGKKRSTSRPESVNPRVWQKRGEQPICVYIGVSSGDRVDFMVAVGMPRPPLPSISASSRRVTQCCLIETCHDWRRAQWEHDEGDVSGILWGKNHLEQNSLRSGPSTLLFLRASALFFLLSLSRAAVRLYIYIYTCGRSICLWARGRHSLNAGEMSIYAGY